MKLPRSQRLVAALLALVSLLFMQLAVAAYACPMVSPAPAYMADCQGMDRANPTLCQAHAESSEQSLDKAANPEVQPFIAAAVLVEVAAVGRLLPRGMGSAPWSVPDAGPAPPIAILHCCLRI